MTQQWRKPVGLLLVVLVGCKSAASQGEQGLRWPSIQNVDLSVALPPAGAAKYIDTFIFSKGGEPLYRLVCRGGDDEYRAKIEAETDVSSYGPDLLCILNVGRRESDVSLLSEDDASAIHSRGHFYRESVEGKCGEYPEYGRIRHFRLRGMRIELRMTPASWTKASPAMEGDASGRTDEVFSIRATNDAAARTAISEQPGFLDPAGDPKACMTPKRGNAPRMCRDSLTFSWGPCPPGSEFEKLPWE